MDSGLRCRDQCSHLDSPSMFAAWGLESLLTGLVWAHRAPAGEPTRHLQLLLLALAACNTLLALGSSPRSIAIAPLCAVLYAVMPTVARAGTLTEAYELHREAFELPGRLFVHRVALP